MQVSYRSKSWTFDHRMTVAQVLKSIKILPETVLVVRNGILVTEDQHLEIEDEVRVVSVISGG